MPVSGASTSSTPFGFGTPATAPAAATEGPALVRFINTGSGDYELNTETGQFKKMPATRQRVLLICKTLFGSSLADQKLGIFRPPKMDNTFERRLESSARVAFRQMTDVEKIIRIDSLTITRVSTGRAQLLINYTDFTALTPDDREQNFSTIV